MNARTVVSFLICVTTASLATAADGLVIHDKTNTCQLVLPSGWTAAKDTAWIGTAPSGQGFVELISQPGRTVKPISDMAQKALMINKMISNTPQSVLYSNEPTKSDNPITPYRAVVPGKGGTCVAMFSARPGMTEDTVKKVAATLSPTK